MHFSDSNSSSDEDDTPSKACGKHINAKLKVDDCDINNGQISSAAQGGYDGSNGLKIDQTNSANSTWGNFTKRNGNIVSSRKDYKFQIYCWYLGFIPFFPFCFVH